MNGYTLHFDPTSYDDLFQPRVLSDESDTALPLLVEGRLLNKIRGHLARLPEREYDFDTYCQVVAGACSLTMKYGDHGAL